MESPIFEALLTFSPNFFWSRQLRVILGGSEKKRSQKSQNYQKFMKFSTSKHNISVEFYFIRLNKFLVVEILLKNVLSIFFWIWKTFGKNFLICFSTEIFSLFRLRLGMFHNFFLMHSHSVSPKIFCIRWITIRIADFLICHEKKIDIRFWIFSW